jgi:hypothetical protein
MLHTIRGPVLFGAVCLLAGCWGGVTEITYPETNATLSGTVSYGKDKVGVGLVIVENGTGSAHGFLDDEGQFYLSNVPLGEVSIGVNTDAGKGPAMGKMKSQTQGKAKAPPRIVAVPKKYQDPAKSGIKTTIREGENHFDIVIPK